MYIYSAAFNPYPYDPLPSYTFEDLKKANPSCFQNVTTYGDDSEICYQNSIIYIYNKTTNEQNVIQNISALSEATQLV